MNDDEGKDGYITEATVYVQSPNAKLDIQIKVIGMTTKGLMAKLLGLEKTVMEAGFATSSVAQRNQQVVAAVQATERNSPTCPDCGGPMEYKTGVAKKNNRPWAGWFCLRTADLPQNKRHTPVWED